MTPVFRLPIYRGQYRVVRYCARFTISHIQYNPPVIVDGAMVLSRRSLIGALGVLLPTGCLQSSTDLRGGNSDDGSSTEEPTTDEDSSEQVPDRCEIGTRSEWGQGDPVEATVTATGDDSQSDCVASATDLALEETLKRSDVALYSSPPQWIQSYSRDVDGEPIVELSVRAERQSEYTGDGSVTVCPPESYSFDDLLSSVPSRVTIDGDESGSDTGCSFRVRLKQTKQQLD